MTDMDDLDRMFATASQGRDVPSAPLLTRIVQDADREQAALQRPVPQRPQAVPKGWLAALADWFGGGLSLAGMSAAALIGVYLGVAQPTPVLALADLVTGQATIDSLEVLPATGTLWTQE